MSDQRWLTTSLALLSLAIASGCKDRASSPAMPTRLPDAETLRPTSATAGILSNNAGRLTGVITGPSAGLIGNNAGGLLSNNAAGLIANNSAGVIANNGGALVGNNAGGLVSNNSGGFRLLVATGDLTAVVGAQVTAHALDGTLLSEAAVVTDAQGRYTLGELKPSGATVVVRAAYAEGGYPVSIAALADAPREAGNVEASLGPATSLVAKKALELAQADAAAMATLRAADARAAAAALLPTLSDEAAVAAVVLDDNLTAQVFDGLVARDPAVRSAVSAALADAGLLTRTAPRPVPRPASPAPLLAAPAQAWYDERLAEGFHLDHTWNGAAQSGFEVTPYSGAAAIAWTARAGGGLKLLARAPVETAGYATLTFALRGAKADQRLALQLLDGSTPLGHTTALEAPPVGEWRRYDLSLSKLAGADRSISGFMIMELAGEDQPTIHLDRVGLER